MLCFNGAWMPSYIAQFPYGDCYKQVRHLMADFGPARFFSREVPWTNSLCLARYLEGCRLISILGEPNWWQALTAARGGALHF